MPQKRCEFSSATFNASAIGGAISSSSRHADQIELQPWWELIPAPE
jgi:hypothetical protein